MFMKEKLKFEQENHIIPKEPHVNKQALPTFQDFLLSLLLPQVHNTNVQVEHYIIIRIIYNRNYLEFPIPSRGF